MHQHPPQTPLWRSTKAAKSGHVDGVSGLVVKADMDQLDDWTGGGRRAVCSLRQDFFRCPDFVLAGQHHSLQERHMADASKDFEAFLKQREAASSAFVNGDANPLAEISTHKSPATLFGPKGDCVQDADKVNKANAEGSKRFKDASRNDFQLMHMAADENLAYCVGVQRSVVQLQGEDQPVPFDLRVTEIFRREGGQWKLIHRHADRLSK